MYGIYFVTFIVGLYVKEIIIISIIKIYLKTFQSIGYSRLIF